MNDNKNKIVNEVKPIDLAQFNSIEAENIITRISVSKRIIASHWYYLCIGCFILSSVLCLGFLIFTVLSSDFVTTCLTVLFLICVLVSAFFALYNHCEMTYSKEKAVIFVMNKINNTVH